MWYSEATDQLDTFYPELWRNVRYGGRTISLSYECVNERGIVIELRKPGRLEEISRIEEIIRGVDRLQEAPARCDVAVVMGLEACCNRLANLNGNGAWDSLRGVLKEAFTLARDLENSGYNCDLIGSDEIGRGHLFVDEDGYLRYGNQQYRYLILAYPQFAKPVLADFAGRVMVSRTGFCVVGQYDRDFDGNPVTFCPDVPRFAHRPEITDIISLFEGYEVSKNRVQNGCILQNGDIILTAPAPDRAVGNRFVSRFSHHGRIYLIEAEDVAYLKLSPDGMLSECWSPRLLRCEVN